MLPEALPYHLKVRDHFKNHGSVWEIFSSAPTTEENGELEIAARIVTAIADHPGSGPGYLNTARLFTLYTKIYCDRHAQTVVDGPDHAVRVKALQLWQEQGEAAGPAIARMVEGARELGSLDLFSRARLRELTRELIREFLRPAWVRTSAVLSLAHAYFPGLDWEDGAGEERADSFEKLTDELAGAHGSVRDYFAFVLLDLACLIPPWENA